MTVKRADPERDERVGPEAGRHALQLSLPADHAAEHECDDEPQHELELRPDVQGFHVAQVLCRGIGGRPASSRDHVAADHAWRAPPARTRQSQIATKPSSRRPVAMSNPPPMASSRADRRPQHAEQERRENPGTRACRGTRRVRGPRTGGWTADGRRRPKCLAEAEPAVRPRGGRRRRRGRRPTTAIASSSDEERRESQRRAQHRAAGEALAR